MIQTIRKLLTSWEERGTGRSPALYLAVAGLGLLAAITCATVSLIDHFRERALQGAERELSGTVRMLSRHFDEQFADSATIAADLMRRLDIQRLESADQLRSRLSDENARAMMRSQSISYLGDISIFDIHGDMINWSRTSPVPKLNVAEREYFKRFTADPTSPDLLTEIARSFLTGKWQMIIAQRLRGNGGIFVGVLIRRIDLLQFERFFSSINSGTENVISLFGSDGTMLARHPAAPEAVGRRFDPSKLSLLRDDRRTIRGPGALDAAERLAAGAQLEHVPAIVVASKTVEAALEDWHLQTRATLTVAALTALAAAMVLVWIILQIVRDGRENRRRLESERERLDTALNNMIQGLVVYDKNGYVVSINRSFFEMFGLDPAVSVVGWHFRELVDERKRLGHFHGDADAFCAEVQQAIAAGQVVRMASVTPDGRSYLALNRPLRDGGWVSTIEDTTDRTRIEHERDRNLAFVHEIMDNIPALITVKDADTRKYLLANRNADRYLGLNGAGIIGQTISDLLPASEAEAISEMEDRLVCSEENVLRSEKDFRGPYGETHFLNSTRVAIRDASGQARYIVSVYEDVTERKLAEDRIAHLAHYDGLTELPNRVLFRSQMERLWSEAGDERRMALLYIDIDGFKDINDTLGHDVGDRLLQQIAARLRDCLGTDDLIARLGGDEFAIVMCRVDSREQVLDLVSLLHAQLREPFNVGGHRLSSDASVGIAIARDDARDIDEWIRHADLAMYAAKSDGRRTHRFFESHMTDRARARLVLEQDLRDAIAGGELELHYQPLVDGITGAVLACEALVRWCHPERGMISPAEFIPIAEEAGLIADLGEWVLRTACAEATSWPREVGLAVNVSPLQFRSASFALTVTSALMATGFSPTRLEIEVTEAVFIRDDEAALSVLHRLREMGIAIALDDFGTGYSSLSYLRRFPFDKVKIDRSFVANLEEPGCFAIVQAILSIAAAWGMMTTAEGVETKQQRDILHELGCDQMQGYLFARPVPSSVIARMLAGDHVGGASQ
ncbi:MAG: EAL domain-containing protein [Alcaligenaceae bacterium]|nr:MAG: EAL domain-containing protein [Alcaligenaceae bacterium]